MKTLFLILKIAIVLSILTFISYPIMVMKINYVMEFWK